LICGYFPIVLVVRKIVVNIIVGEDCIAVFFLQMNNLISLSGRFNDGWFTI